jgi:hypothetical protein
MMGWVADTKQAWQDHRAAIDREYTARGGIKAAKRSGDDEMLERAQNGLKDAKTAQRKAADCFWGRLVK